MEIALDAAALFLVAAALLSRLRRGDWWIRIFDFPRLQLAALGTLVLLAYLVTVEEGGAASGWIQFLLLLATLFQLARIRPFTPIAEKQVSDASREERTRCTVRLMIANVYMPNRNADGLIEQVREQRPDLLLAVETDAWWEQRLRVLEADLPYTLKHPLPNTYGMLLFSRLRLQRPEVRFLVEQDVPSIYTAVELPHCRNFTLYCLHPRPPRPFKRQDSVNRDAELVIVGHQLRHRGDPVIVAGDLNDVAWSYTTTLFQRLSGLLDPRRGRGLFNTFDANRRLLRYPLDHVFHSAHFRLVHLQRLRRYGSDHFPILVELSYERHAIAEQDAPEAAPDEVALSHEMLERVNPERQT